MKTKLAAIGLLILAAAANINADSGAGDLKIGYVLLDEEGNRSVNQSSFNIYEGFGISLDRFFYAFDSGIQIRSNLNNINLENRRLYFNLGKPGLFGASVGSNQYRRIYNFEGSDFTKRNQTSAGLWFRPQRYIKLFAKSSINNFRGTSRSLFLEDLDFQVGRFDYQRTRYSAGANFNYRGRAFYGEYSRADYNDKIDEARDQKRTAVKLKSSLIAPRFTWLNLSGGFKYFQTEYKSTGFKLESTTAYGGALVTLPSHLSLNYLIFFNRAGSDSDLVKTDNLAQTIYASFSKPQTGGITAGYQNDIHDDLEEQIKANSFYLSAWLLPLPRLELRGEYGFRAEDVDEGARLVGDEDRSRFKISGKYRFEDRYSFGIRIDSKIRKNKQLGSDVNFIRVALESTAKFLRYFQLVGGYAYVSGEYQNNEQEFEFAEHQVFGDVNIAEYRNMLSGFGFTYYRSGRDLDVESFSLRFMGGYRFSGGFRVEATYNVYNFDDFLVTDKYYTENMIEINLIKSLAW